MPDQQKHDTLLAIDDAERDIKLLQAVEDWIRLQTHNNVVDYRLLTSEEEKRRRKDFSKAIRRLASRFDEYN